MAATEEQIRDWKQDGYLHLKGLLTSDEVRELTDVLDRMPAATGTFPGGWI